MSRAVSAERDLWSLVLDQPEIDPDDLALAIEREARKSKLDFRTRLLIRDSVDCLRRIWGTQPVAAGLHEAQLGATIQAIASDDLGPAGFSLLSSRIMQATRSETIIAFLRELGISLAQPEKMVI